jgi:hypothetical protein
MSKFSLFIWISILISTAVSTFKTRIRVITRLSYYAEQQRLLLPTLVAQVGGGGFSQ